MNKNHQAALAALRELDKIGGVTEASALAAMQTRASLALAEEQTKTNKNLELANAIAYAQLCLTSRDGDAYIDAMEAVDRAREAVDIAPEEDTF
jgi:hypothetical protein